MSGRQTHKYRCHAVLEQGKPCNRPCWGKTAYCRWHNACLTWHGIKMIMSPDKQIGMPGRSPFDPAFAEKWKTSSYAKTSNILGLLFGILFGWAVIWALTYFGVAAPTYTPKTYIEIGLFLMGGICVWAMYNGNRNVLFPKLLIGTIIAWILIQYLGWITDPKSTSTESILTTFGPALGLLLWSLPLLPGPVLNAYADIQNREELPPLHIGYGLGKVTGVVLIIISRLLLPILEFSKTTLGTTRITGEITLGSDLFFQGGTFFVIAIFICGFGAMLGSVKSIRLEWHREDIYSRCIRPSVYRVISLPMFASAFCSGVIYIVFTIIGLTGYWIYAIALIVGIYISFKWAKRRGKQIYPQNIRRAGYQ